MTDYGEKSELRGRQVPDRDRLDDELDVALAKYAAAEPKSRTGGARFWRT